MRSTSTERELEDLKNILVLGSRGQIGRDLSVYLQSRGLHIQEIDIQIDNSHDLRLEGNPILSEKVKESDFVVFLAFDVGGAKYLSQKNNDRDFIFNNILIMQNVFDCLIKHQKPFLFASSQMSQIIDSTYGNLKRLGENITRTLGGKSIRFWNVYGIESFDLRSHAITDFIHSAVNNREINVLTNGREERDFLYVRDASHAIHQAIDNFDVIPECLDIASFRWISIAEVANKVGSHFDVPVSFSESENSISNQKFEPTRDVLRFWAPKTSIDEGIKLIATEITKNPPKKL